ncbi:MAG TPA: endo alpha-1,4 polygalactosaminidase, partial [Chloroflexota bacterium]|nr:endo alpha-1,4 polygalactosaminidase [Chloroflexota bacterium]
DIRQIDVLLPILRGRMNLCAAKGFDAVQLDNLDGFQASSGFDISAADQLRYNVTLANEAHSHGLAVALTNDPAQAADLAPYFDWVVAEECVAQAFCGQLQPFTGAGKPALDIEYRGQTSDICPGARSMGVTAVRKNQSLDAFVARCP